MSSDTSNEPLRPKPPSTQPPPFFADAEEKIIPQKEQRDNKIVKSVKAAIGEDVVSITLAILFLLLQLYKNLQTCFKFKNLVFNIE